MSCSGANFRSYAPSQADVVTFKAVPKEPAVQNFPHAYRWYNHIKSYEAEFSSLPGDPSKAFTTYGPEAVAVTENPKKAPEDDDDVDLFGSDDEEEDAEVVAERERRLAEYKKKKEGKTKPAAKSMVTMDGQSFQHPFSRTLLTTLQSSKFSPPAETCPQLWIAANVPFYIPIPLRLYPACLRALMTSLYHLTVPWDCANDAKAVG